MLEHGWIMLNALRHNVFPTNDSLCQHTYGSLPTNNNVVVAKIENFLLELDVLVGQPGEKSGHNG